MGEDPRRPRYLETLHRAGYQLLIDDPAAVGLGGARSAAAPVVGRSRELQRLRRLADDAREGTRCIVFVSGEIGIGKTTLVETFLTEIAPGSSRSPSILSRTGAAALVASGHCIEAFGAGKPYMPLFEAIGRLGRERDAAFVVDTLRKNAPAWLARIPRLVAADERARLQAEMPAPTQESMLRQIADGIEALCEHRLLVLVLEDLHLSDPATLELIALVAKRRGPAQLLLLATMRTGEVHPGGTRLQRLVRDLVLHRQAEEIVVAPLSRDALESYLIGRFARVHVPHEVATTIHARTEGNPLFATQLVTQLVADGSLRVDEEAAELRADVGEIARQVPRDVRAMIEQRFDSLPEDERTLLEGASVAGVSFRSNDVAYALDVDTERVELLCSRIGRETGYLGPGDPVDGIAGARFAFRHALYQQALYERLEPARRRRLHRAIGESLVNDVSDSATAWAAEIAFHFDRGGAVEQAVTFYDKAALSAVAHAATREAVGYLDRGLELLASCPDDAPHRQRRLDLLLTRGPLVLAIRGYGAEDVLDNYRRSLGLARQLGSSIPEISSLLALAIGELARAELQKAEDLAAEVIRVSEEANLPPPFVAQLRNPLSQVRLYQGRVAESLNLADAAVAAIDVLALPQPPPESRPALWAEPRVLLHCQRAAASFAMGLTAQAGAAIDQALAIARELRHPFNLTYALCYAALYEGTIGRWEVAVGLARQAIETGEQHDVRFWAAVARMYGGHALARSGDPSEGLELLRRGIGEWHDSGGRLMTSLMQNLLADTSLAAGDVDAAEAALVASQAHSERTGETVFFAETLRLQAECLQRRGAPAMAQAAVLGRAIEVARAQGTRLRELRATLALSRLRPGSAPATPAVSSTATVSSAAPTRRPMPMAPGRPAP